MMFSGGLPITGFTHLADVTRRPEWIKKWERMKRKNLYWLVECLAETVGVYIYVYCGVGANAAFTIGSLSKAVGLGSLQTVALGYALGIAIAVSIAGSTSGGHLNPAVTIGKAVWKGFPWRKVPQYILAQTLGAFLACLAVYLQYRSTLLHLEEALIASGEYDTIQFTPEGVAGIFASYTKHGGNLFDVFCNEFFVDFYLALVIWGVLDPTNFFVPPPSGPWVIGLAYGTAIWAFGPGTLSTNTARDVGGRVMAYLIWGKSSISFPLWPIGALTNIPATLAATLFYELVLTDTSRVLPRAHMEFINGDKAYLNHRVLNPELRKISNLNNSSTDRTEYTGVEHVAL